MSLQWWCFATTEPWSWTWRPVVGVWVALAALEWGYRRLVRGLPRAPRWRTWCRGVALLLLWAALDWPLGPLGASHFASLHMVRYLAAGVVAPALLVLAVPPEAYLRLNGHPRARATLGALTRPLVAFCLFNAVLTVTHWPSVVDTLVPTQLGSFALDVAWFGAGAIFWWPLLAPVPERPGFHPLARMGYLALNAILIRPPWAMMIFSEQPIYATYELAPPPAGDAMEDQQLAGAIMGIGNAWIMFSALVAVFYDWVRRSGEVFR